MQKYGLEIDDKKDLVSMFYLIWHKPVIDSGEIYNCAKIIAENPDNPEWGPLNSFHYWAKPEPGYYSPDNPEIIKKHVKQLNEAGIDFLVIDNTNANSDWKFSMYNEIFLKPAETLLDTMLEIRKGGKKTPYIVFWNGSWSSDDNPEYISEDLYERFYKKGKYDELFVSYKGKPLLLVTDLIPESLKKLFTIRKTWGLQKKLAEKEWSFLQHSPQSVTINRGQPEHMSISVAAQKTYITKTDALTRRGGKTFAEQWKRAFEIRPKILLITAWNEWIAQRFEVDGETHFVDAYTPEASRDIEPMKELDIDIPLKFPDNKFDLAIFTEAMYKRGLKWEQMSDVLRLEQSEIDKIKQGKELSKMTDKVVKNWLAAGKGHGDLYYKWLKKYIKAYKNHGAFPEGLLQW